MREEFSAARGTRPRAAPSEALIPYRIGDVVQHPEFGVGVVTAKSGDLDDLKIRVAFEGMGSKLLAVKFAPLKKLR
jgi:DNA helicase-2/ATP-dependent DNA helicase PcrA